MRTLLYFFFLLMGLTSFSQVCTPDSSYTQPGIYPDTTENLPEGCAEALYETVLTAVIPAETLYSGFTVPIFSISVDSVEGLPPGFTYVCSVPDCDFPGDSYGCVLISGNPVLSDVGIHEITVYLTGHSVVQVPFELTGYELVINAPPVIATDSLSNPSQCGSADGFIGLEISPGTAQACCDVSWSDSAWGSMTEVNGIAGAYSVSVTDDAGCVSTENFSLNDPDAPEIIDFMVDQFVCAEDSGLSAAATVSGGTPPYSFNWGNGNTDSIQVVTGGTYSVTVTDVNGCAVGSPQTSSIVPAPIQENASVQGVSCNGEMDGEIYTDVQGGVAPYQWEWSTGATGTFITALDSGLYYLTLTDVLNCQHVYELEVAQPAELSLSMSGLDASCPTCEDGTAFADVSGGSLPYQYEWSTGVTLPSISDLGEGMFYVTVTDNHDCVVVDSIFILHPMSSIERGITSDNWLIFPNPSSGKLTMKVIDKFIQGSVLTILDFRGQVILKDQMNTQVEEHTYDLSEFPVGMYYIKVDTEGESTVHKWVKW